MAIKFYNKIGKSSFMPIIEAENIILDNQFIPSTVPGEEENTIQYNGLLLNFIVKFKQDLLDNWISDSEYQNYSQITFAILQDRQEADIFSTDIKAAILQTEIANAINKFSSSIKYQTIKFADFIDTEQTASNLQLSFNELNPLKDIILFVIPSIDFVTYFKDNNLEETEDNVEILIKRIYNSEFMIYNVVVKNKVIDDSKVVIDLREINKLKTQLPNLQQKINVDQDKNKNSMFLSDIYTSFDYENNLTRNYVFFNISDFIAKKTIYNNIFSSYTIEELDNILLQNKCISFTITKSFLDSTEKQICFFNASYNKIIGSNNVELIKELTTDNRICFSFNDDIGLDSNQSFKYQISVNFKDPFTKTYYNNSITPSTGVYYDTINYLQEIESFANDPRNTNVKSGKFAKIQIAPEVSLKKLVTNFFKMVNAISSTQISKATVDKVYESLKYKNSTYLIHFDFINYIKTLLPQIESILINQKLQTTQIIKNGNLIHYKNKQFYFKLDDFDNSKSNPKIKLNKEEIGQELLVKYFNEVTNNTFKQYLISSSNIDSSNPITFKIINSAVSLSNSEVTYSSEYDLSSILFESQGATFKTISSLTKKIDKTNSLFDKSSFSNDVFQKASNIVVDSKKQISKSIESIQSKKITNIVNNSKNSKKTDLQSSFTFQTTFLNDANSEFLIPKVNIEIFDPSTNEWMNPNNVQNKNNTYLARTNYIQKNNIFYSKKVVPPIINEYFVLQLNNKVQ